MFREVSVVEIREVLRAWLAGHGLRVVATQAGVDRKTARRYVEAAVAVGLDRAGGVDQLDDELIGAVVTVVRPDRPHGYGQVWEVLCANHDQIDKWVDKGLTVVKIGDLLARQGVIVPQRTLHRYCQEHTQYQGRRRGGTVPLVDGEPGMECQIDFARMGMLFDSVTGRRRVVHALIFTAVYSRHMFVWLTFSQTLTAVIDGCEAAWAFFGGVFKVLIPDNMSTVVAHADSVNPRFTVGWLDYAQARGFSTDPARVAHPQDKPRVERMVQYVRNNFFAGEEFTDLADAQDRARVVRPESRAAHPRHHLRPAGAGVRRAGSASVVGRPVGALCGAGVCRGQSGPRLSRPTRQGVVSIPHHLRGQTISARADGELAKFYHRGQLVKTHPRQPAGTRSTDPADLPADKTGYAMRDLHRLIATAAGHGSNIGIYAERLLDHDLPWTKMRQVYRLLGLVKRYGPGPVQTACARALDLDVVSVTKIAAMLEQATENTPVRHRGPLRGWRRPGSPAIPATTAQHPDPHPGRTGCTSSTATAPTNRARRDCGD